MSRIWTPACAGLALALSTPAAATGTAAAAPGGEHYVIGHVQKAAKDRLEIEGESQGHVSLRLDGRTRIRVEGRQGSASTRDLQPGSPVFAAYEGTGDHRIATRVVADPARTSAAPLNAPAGGAQEGEAHGQR